MDLSQFDTREKAEAGADIPLRRGQDVVKGDDGEPITFRIKGVADNDVGDAFFTKAEALVKVKGKGMAVALEEYQKTVLRAAVIGWSDNFSYKGEKMVFPDALEIIISIPAIRTMLFSEVQNEANFLPTP